MDGKSYNIRVPKRWVRVAMIVGVTALIVAPLTAVATHSFDDVPNDNTFHNDIAWLKDAAVTLGCNPPDNDEFCPEDNVTREQMAAFMRRLAENQVVDAGAIQGFEPADLTSQALHSRDDSFVALADGVSTNLATLDLPPGSYLILARVDLNNNGANTTSPSGNCTLEAGSSTSTYEIPGLFGVSGPGDRYGMSAQLVHTFDATGQAVLTCTPAGWSGNGFDPAITAISVSGGIATQAVTQSSSGSGE
jgi:hypothetical protein